jgi:SAM-dependent methyltransferase
MDASGPADAAFFDNLYTQDPDPWDYASDPYEQAKYVRQLDWLTDGGRRRLHRTLEVGCSIGVFTRMLAASSDRVEAFDVSGTAIDIARRTLRGVDNVSLGVRAFPMPDPPDPGRYDAIVVSEVLYYLDDQALATAVAWLSEAIGAGAAVVTANFLPAERTPIVLDALETGLGVHRLRRERTPPAGADDQGRAYVTELFGPG